MGLWVQVLDVSRPRPVEGTVHLGMLVIPETPPRTNPSPCVQMSFRHLWKPTWMDGSLPVMDSVLDCLKQELADLIDLQPACRQVRLVFTALFTT